MAKLVGFKKTRTAIFISGAGSNFKKFDQFLKKEKILQLKLF